MFWLGRGGGQAEILSLSTAYEAALQSNTFEVFQGGAGGASPEGSPDDTVPSSTGPCPAVGRDRRRRPPLARRLDGGNADAGHPAPAANANGGTGSGAVTALRQTTRVLAKIKRWNADLDNVGGLLSKSSLLFRDVCGMPSLSLAWRGFWSRRGVGDRWMCGHGEPRPGCASGLNRVPWNLVYCCDGLPPNWTRDPGMSHGTRRLVFFLFVSTFPNYPTRPSQDLAMMVGPRLT